MREFSDTLHIVKITALECDMRKRDERGIVIDGSFERGEIRCNVIIHRADAYNFMPLPSKSFTIPCRIYRSDGKLNVSVIIRFRSGCKVKAAVASLYKLSDVWSLTITCPFAAPRIDAIFSPIRAGASHQPLFQPRMRSVPHSSSTAVCMRSITALGIRPNELPSR